MFTFNHAYILGVLDNIDTTKEINEDVLVNADMIWFRNQASFESQLKDYVMTKLNESGVTEKFNLSRSRFSLMPDGEVKILSLYRMDGTSPKPVPNAAGDKWNVNIQNAMTGYDSDNNSEEETEMLKAIADHVRDFYAFINTTTDGELYRKVDELSCVAVDLADAVRRGEMDDNSNDVFCELISKLRDLKV